MRSIEEIKAKIKSIDYRHYVCAGISVGFVFLTVFAFPHSFGRIGEAFRDLGLTIAYFFMACLNLWFGVSNTVTPTVGNVSKMPFELSWLPPTWEEFTEKWSLFWQEFINENNFLAYLSSIGKGAGDFSRIVMFVIPVFVLLYIFMRRKMLKENNDYNRDTKYLKRFKKFSDKTYRPVKQWILDFVLFCKQNPIHYRFWLFALLFSFNVFSIILEAIAFYYYFCVSFDIGNLYIQAYKLLLDLSVIPVFVWVILGLALFFYLRVKRAYDNLEHMEAKNEGFLLDLGVVVFFVGRMGTGKTEMMTSSALSMERAFRDKSLEIIQKCDLRFPYFPWINFELEIQKKLKDKEITSLASMILWVRELKRIFDYTFVDSAVAKSYRRYLNKKGWRYKNLLFDYDFRRYGLTYNDRLKVHSIFDVLETYGRAYLCYITSSSLIESNYSIRSDNEKISIGNFPQWNTDFFHRRAEDQDSTSKYAHILDFDSMKLGKKFIQGNNAAMEFGVKCVTEIGKERLNAVETKGLKKEDKEPNQLNDGTNDYLKMSRHPALIEFFAFLKIFCDDQRPESWGADARDLTEIVHLDNKSDEKLCMPGFFVMEIIYAILKRWFSHLHVEERFARGDNCLTYYILHSFYAKVHSYYTRIYNKFGYRQVDVSTEEGTQDGERSPHKYFLMNMQVHSDRYSSDCFRDILAERILRDTTAYDDRPTYKSSKATFEEMEKQNSYFVRRLDLNVLNNEQFDFCDSEYVSLVNDLSEQYDLPKETVVKLMQKQREKLLAKEIEGMMNQ